MKGFKMKFLFVCCTTFMVWISHASEPDEMTTINVNKPVQIVLVCPNGTKHEGEELPQGITNDNAIEYFCDGPKSEMDTEIGE